MSNVPLLYQEAPELRDILALFHITLAEPMVTLSTEELGARFQTLVDTVFGVVADVKATALVRSLYSRYIQYHYR